MILSEGLKEFLENDSSVESDSSGDELVREQVILMGASISNY